MTSWESIEPVVLGVVLAASGFAIAESVGWWMKRKTMKENEELAPEPEEEDEVEAPPLRCASTEAHHAIRKQHRRGNITAAIGGIASLGLLLLGAWSEWRRSQPPKFAMPTYWTGETNTFTTNFFVAPEVRYVTNTVIRFVTNYSAEAGDVIGLGERDYKRAAYAGALSFWTKMLEGQTNVSLPGSAEEAWKNRRDEDFRKMMQSAVDRFPGGFVTDGTIKPLRK